MINKVCSTIVGSNDAVVSLRTFAHSHKAPFIVCSHQLLATSVAIVAIVHHVRIKNGTLTLSIFVWTIRLFRAEHSHLVSTIRRIETIAHKEIIIFAYVLYVRAFARNIISARNLLAEIRVARHTICRATNGRIGNIVIAQTSLCIELQHPDTSRPRAVSHP